MDLASATNNFTCKIFAPVSQNFSAIVYKEWGVGGIVFLVVPVLCSLISLGLYTESIAYIMRKSNSKDLRNSLVWLLGTQPTIICIATIGVFMPRSLVYLTFMYNIYFAYANYKYYYLIMVFAGGSKPFVDKSSSKPIKTNLVPCCCLCCLPKINNSMRATDMAKWFIFQNVVFTPLFGALSVVLKADSKLYSLHGVSASVYLSTFNSISSLFSIYGFKMIATFTKQIEGMEESHMIKGKTGCMQLTMFILGFEGLIFNIFGQAGLFPCQAPFAFNSRRKAINNYAVIIQCFLLLYPMRKYYRRRLDLERQAVLNDDISLGHQNRHDFHNVKTVDRVGNVVETDRVVPTTIDNRNYGSRNSDFQSLNDEDKLEIKTNRRASSSEI